MAVDYRRQYTPDQLEPFWPNEILRMITVVLCTLAIVMMFAILPMLLQQVGLGDLVHHQEPADPRSTPEHIRPEWYFLAVYQYLKLPPQEILGISGKSIGVLSQAPAGLALLLLPFFTGRWAHHRPGLVHTGLITLVIALFIALTLWAAWPPHPFFLAVLILVLVVFYLLLWVEVRTIDRVLRQPGRQNHG